MPFFDRVMEDHYDLSPAIGRCLYIGSPRSLTPLRLIGILNCAKLYAQKGRISSDKNHKFGYDLFQKTVPSRLRILF
jgi:hypothetical protein